LHLRLNVLSITNPVAVQSAVKVAAEVTDEVSVKEAIMYLDNLSIPMVKNLTIYSGEIKAAQKPGNNLLRIESKGLV